MVQNHQVQKMEDEEDLEALRLAALQTIRSRKGSRRPIAPVTAHRHLEKQSFCRHVTNPNLIAIVPTDPRTDIESSEPSSICNGSDGIGEGQRVSLRNKINTAKKVEVASEENVKEKPKTGVNKNISEQSKDVKEDVDNSKNDGEASESEVPETVDRTGNLNFDEDVLDFEGDTVMLHDDDDSLDRLMDEMEQEFSQETVPNKSNSSGQSKLKEAKSSKKIPLKSKEINIRSSSPSSVTNNAPSSSSLAPENETKSKSPSPRNSVKSSSFSPNTRSPPFSRKRYSSPSPPPRRRSPYSPRLKRRRSQTPPPLPSRRYSRSPPSRFGRNRSPYPSKYNGKRNSVSPRRRNISSSPSRRYPIRTSPPPRRKFSPALIKRRSISPGVGRHRRSPNRNMSEADSRHHRWRSPHHKKMGSLNKRELGSARISKNTTTKASSPVQRIPVENKSDKNEKKSIINKLQDDIEMLESDNVQSSESLDPKLEARRRKFESSVFVNPSNKKICLKSSKAAETTIKKRKDDIQKVSYLNNDDNNSQITSTSSKTNVESTVIKHYPQELTTGRRVTEMTKRDSSVQAGHGLKKKKRIVLKEDGDPHSIRLELSPEPVSEIRKKSKLKHSLLKFNDDSTEVKKLKTEKPLSEFETEINENTLIVKKVSKKKKRSKELKRKREIMLDLVQNEVLEKPEEINISDEEEVIKDEDDEVVNDIPTKVKSNISKPGDDLRAEISRRRAERLKGVTNPMARIIQSAFEDVVANRKKFETRKAVAQDKEKKPPTTSGVIFKSKGNRRVHVLEEPSTKTTSHYTDEESSNESSELEDYSDDGESRNFINLSKQRNSTAVRTASSGSGRSILRRSQV
ncbi:hypothetical protein O3M35_008588 [Rhynocoris fuscipes]|uniref:Uncharacterized protein n=1 Tax=Rhynocoris fuscipes TaxID=488301 RepID=A0AAW1D7G5_9HEMI